MAAIRQPAASLHCKDALPRRRLSCACGLQNCTIAGVSSIGSAGTRALSAAAAAFSKPAVPCNDVRQCTADCWLAATSVQYAQAHHEGTAVVRQATAAAARPARRRRLDDVCLELRPADARNVIQSWIVQGKVRVDGKVVTKAGTPVQPDAVVRINAVVPKFVCRCEAATALPHLLRLQHCSAWHPPQRSPRCWQDVAVFGLCNPACLHGHEALMIRTASTVTRPFASAAVSFCDHYQSDFLAKLPRPWSQAWLCLKYIRSWSCMTSHSIVSASAAGRG